MASHFTLPGKVYFTAIGPGPAKRLTLRTLELLRGADLIVHDDLVPEDVLELIPPHVAVQKLGNALEEVHRRMSEAAQNGQYVVRLMFSGPLSTSEPQREIAALRQAGIEAELVPSDCSATAEANCTLNEEQTSSGSIQEISLDVPRSSEFAAS